jgi:hypothetical protein
MKTGTKLGAALALAALGTGTGAQAADAASCLTEAEVSSLVVYGLPQAIAASRVSCSAQLAPDGFLATRGSALESRYSAAKNAAWPQAKIGLIKLATASTDRDVSTLESLPDETVRPLIDALIQQKVAEAIEPGTCGEVEQLAQLLAPLEPQQLGAISGLLAAFVLKKEGPRICRATNP